MNPDQWDRAIGHAFAAVGFIVLGLMIAGGL